MAIVICILSTHPSRNSSPYVKSKHRRVRLSRSISKKGHIFRKASRRGQTPAESFCIEETPLDIRNMLALYGLLALTILYFLYASLSSPLAKVPGPWYTLFTSLPQKYHEFSASRRAWIQSLHEQYGHAVRLAPNEVSFSSATAMKEIYTSGGAGYDRTEFYDLFKQFGKR